MEQKGAGICTNSTREGEDRVLIVFGICCWISEVNQLGELRRCLESVKGYRVILVDGKWYDIDHPLQTSIPEAYEMFKEYPNVEVVVGINRHEWENRNLYLERCTKDDILIVLDTDEFVAGNVDEFVCGSDSFPITCFAHRHGGQTIVNRGIAFPYYTRHKDRHNEYWIGKKKLVFDGDTPSDFIISEDRFFRSPKIKEIMLKRGQKRSYR